MRSQLGSSSLESWSLDAMASAVAASHVAFARRSLGAGPMAAGVACVEWTSVYVERKLSGGGMARRARRGGFGLVAMNRAAMQAAALGAPQYVDDDGTRRPAPFLELITDEGSWLGEDLAFFARLSPAVLVEALVTGETWHAGSPLDLTECNGPIFPVHSLDRLTRHPEINATTRLPSNSRG